MIAAISAMAFSFLRRSRSSSWICFASGLFLARDGFLGVDKSAVAASCHSRSVASWRPSLRRKAPSSLASSWEDSTMTRSLSAGVHLPLLSVLMTSTVRAAFNQRDRVACETPVSPANALAEMPRGPAIRWTMRALNPCPYLIVFVLPPGWTGRPLRTFPQVMSLPLDPLIGGLRPPERRATPQPAKGRLRAAPPMQEGRRAGGFRRRLP